MIVSSARIGTGEPDPDTVVGGDRAPLRRRLSAALVDALLPVTVAVAGAAAVSATELPGSRWIMFGTAVPAAAGVLWNSIVFQGRTGMTAGMRMTGLLRVRTGGEEPLGLRRSAQRFGCLIVDLVPVPAGLLRALWNEHGQRLSDRLIGANVVAVDRDAATRARNVRNALLVSGVAIVVLLALLGALVFVQRPADRLRAESRATAAQAATDGAVAVLSYRPESVDQDLAAARAHLTGEFLTAFDALAEEVVAPAAKEKRVAMEATPVGSAVESASPDGASVIVYINQAATLAENQAPSLTQNVVRVGLVRVDGRWLIERFDPLF